jgi:hypothetical protein
MRLNLFMVESSGPNLCTSQWTSRFQTSASGVTYLRTNFMILLNSMLFQGEIAEKKNQLLNKDSSPWIWLMLVIYFTTDLTLRVLFRVPISVTGLNLTWGLLSSWGMYRVGRKPTWPPTARRLIMCSRYIWILRNSRRPSFILLRNYVDVCMKSLVFTEIKEQYIY